MKHLEKSYVAKKSSVIERGHINQFLCQYENSNDGLLMKVAMIIAIHGGLRVSELAALKFDDVRIVGCNYEITIQQSKTDKAGHGHVFAITPVPVSSVCPINSISRYIQLFVNPSGRFFRKFGNNGQPLNQPMGVNSMAKIPEKVAHFLGLEGNFTGHCFRRTSATILADAGANHLQLKRHGRWKSTSVAEGYIDNSKAARVEISNMLNGDSSKAPVSAVDKFVNCQFQNCSVSVNFH